MLIISALGKLGSRDRVLTQLRTVPTESKDLPMSEPHTFYL